MQDQSIEINSTVSLVNVVGNGDLHRDLDIDPIFQLLTGLDQIEDVSKDHHRISCSFEDAGGTISIYRTGKYNIMGSSSPEKLKETNEYLVRVLIDSNVIEDSNLVSFSPTNYVYTVDLGDKINLRSLDMLLGAESEYEPEQYPLLIYQPTTIDCTVTISSSGKCVVNSPDGRENVERALNLLKTSIND